MKDCWELVKDIKEDVVNVEVKNNNVILYTYETMEDVSYSLTFGEENSLLEMLSFAFRKN